MADCPGSKSITSETYSFAETCGKSAEFLRRACTYTPETVKWAGDLVITSNAMAHESLMKYVDGSGACEPEYTFSVSTENCGEKHVRPDGIKDVEESAVKNSNGTFLFTTPEGSPEWSMGIAATSDIL